MDLTQALQIASLSDTGRVRSHNEDCIATRPACGLVILADGMGGYNAGEVASRMATSLIADGLKQAWEAAPKYLTRDESKLLALDLIAEQIQLANEAIYRAAHSDPQCAGMGTTLVMGMFYDNFLAVAHVGDSRLYRLRGERLEQMTRDHSLLQEQLDTGMITLAEARKSHNRNLVTRALGVDPVVSVDRRCHEVQTGDAYLLCSDGLNDLVDDEEIRLTLIALRDNPALAVRQLVQAANDKGGRDNISVILVRVVRGFAVARGWYATLKSWWKV